MGRDLAERFSEARATFEAIDEALGVQLSRLMWEGPEEALTLTHNAQPAILAHSAAVLAVVSERLSDVQAATGHSLGEYSAHVAAGSLSAAEAARLVRRRGELMLEAGRRRPGAMAAVVGLDPDAVEAACRAASQNGSVAVPANLNSPEQTVISGDPEAVSRAGEECKSRGAKRVIPLKVSGAFHSPLMAPAAAGLQEVLAQASFGPFRCPVFANATAEPVRSAPRAVRLLVEQLTAPVRWTECVRASAALAPGAVFLEVGPGSVLTGLLRRIVPDAKGLTLGTAAEVESFLLTTPG
jgi:[acyl-carrier-protein] S-malonyltransferase